MRAGRGRKRLNEIGRMRRRLAESGRVEVEIVAAPRAVRAAVEEFLALEASGWKAGRGAFLSEPSLATFLRSATRLLSAEGLCRVAALRLDGRAVAMGILLESQNRSYFWKIAYDEALRAQAPGVQLAFALTELQLARPEIDLTDSCAIANHPMIDRLWPERIAIADLAVSLDDKGFGSALRRERTRRRIREFAKRVALRVLERKPS
ncbi:GNAT family N-acetyltransferase [Methylocystis sp. IM2]|uniref:GNAT family N-acetyltransferase n=1 Tax=Methylocystis sp. IM2 TaxID=3136563 RepID=UPI0030F58158